MSFAIRSFNHLGLILLGALAALPSLAEVNTSISMASVTRYPLTNAVSAQPLVMLTMSNDHQLFYKAFNDWGDVDGDGLADISYDHDIEYYGYFNPYGCYDYSSGNARFEPQGISANRYCDGVSGSWSGNFLNWAAMTRIDALRKVLYGGTRSTDSGVTVLERSYLPTDAHSFAKYYGGGDINRLTPFSPAGGITLCNTTYAGSGVSETTTADPRIRVAAGDFRYWAANERWQCTWHDERGDNRNVDPPSVAQDSDPHRTDDGLGDYVARVQVCASASLAEDNCKEYPSGALKPTGLLHSYGENGSILFGLLSGSYQKNKSGGVLRKNISSFADEVDATSGNFTGAAGIVSTIDAFRIARYSYSDTGRYNNSDGCPWGVSSFNEGNCSNWGNPISEMYLESLRYFAGMSPSSGFAANDSGYLSGLSSATWADPLSEANWCAGCNVVLINASESSYDDDAVSMSGLNGNPSVSSLTDVVGAGEGIHGSQFFVGENGSDNNQLCTAKTISSLASARGTCPGSPRLSGSYYVAGMAHWARTNDIRDDVSNTQSIETYSVALSPDQPGVVVSVPGGSNTVTILPACRNTQPNPDGNCAIVDFKILSQDIAGGTGRLYVNWEDTEQGGDYDQDMKGTIEYVISGGQVTVTTNVTAKSTPYPMGFGYILGGTTQDGFHVHSGINGFRYNDADVALADCGGGCQHTDAASANAYTIGASSAGLLEQPLWYAAKWGGFDDSDGDDQPDLTGEWDARDLAGRNTPDGVPDNYFPVTNPNALEEALRVVFNRILEKASSGTAAALVSNSVAGNGIAVQALFDPVRRDADDNEAAWIGSLNALWVDAVGLLREDDGDGVLENYSTDPVVELFFDEDENTTRVRRFSSADANSFDFATASSSVHALTELNTLWNAREQLSSQSPLQRSYGSNASSGRYIFTWLDSPDSGAFNRVDAGEQVAFTTTSIDADHFIQLNVATEAEADEIVDWVRGIETEGLRSRTVDYDGDGSTEVMRLGDIVHSTPVVVGAPSEAFDLLYGDTSYRTFRAQYANRRQMVYVGANDGMLHAFNAGFYDRDNQRYQTQRSGETAHPLGAEVWAYVPKALLPHIQYLAQEDYTHAYFVDGKPRVFDAKIFTDDDTHPGGWGTVLVVGMRLGGESEDSMRIDVENDGFADGDDENHAYRSSYVVLDVTDPEQAPTLLGEVHHERLRYTTSYPAVAAIVDAASALNEWYLIFGTGPSDASTGTHRSSGGSADQKGGLGIIDLTSSLMPADIHWKMIARNQVLGDPVVADWDLDFKADTLYVGSSEGTSTSSMDGQLYKLEIAENSTHTAWDVPASLYNTARPVLMRPTVSLDNRGKRWVLFGTGKFTADGDKTNTQTQTLYGLQDAGAASITLADVSSINVFSDGALSSSPGNDVNTQWALESAMDSGTFDGWKIDLTVAASTSERTAANFALLGGALFAPVYTPDNSLCGASGSSRLMAVYYKTGTATAEPILGLDSNTTRNGAYLSLRDVSLGKGMAAAPSLQQGDRKNNPEGTVSVFVQGSLGTIQREEAKPVFNAQSGEVSWKEFPEQ